MAEHAAPVLTKELSLSDDNIRVTSAPLISSAVVPEETETPSQYQRSRYTGCYRDMLTCRVSLLRHGNCVGTGCTNRQRIVFK